MIYVLVNLITGLLYHALDPRIRLGCVQMREVTIRNVILANDS